MFAFRRVVGVVVSLCITSACAQPMATASDEDEQGVHDVAVRLPPFPEESMLCRVVYNQSTPADVAAVLGEPGDKEDSGGGSVNFFYDYDDGASLFVGFLHGVFSDAMVANAPYPGCWSDEENALTAGLQALRSMPMRNENEGGSK